MDGQIILLNGASSAGKSGVARVLQQILPLPFWHYSIDHLRAVQPWARYESGEFAWAGARREAFFDGFHRSLPVIAAAGNALIVEHIIESQAWMDRLLGLLAGHDVFFVGLHCPLDELERRERQRGDRRLGEARADAAITHGFGRYDLECDSSAAAEAVAAQIAAAWAARQAPSAFALMRAGRQGMASSDGAA